MEDRRIRKLGRRGGATLLTLGLALGGLSVFAPLANADGNNGTVKIREKGTADEDVSNDPQINCLEAAWYGFDNTADVTTFDVTFINPTSSATVQHFADQITLDLDAAGGSSDFDGKFQPAIDTTGIDPQNGKWHIRVDVETTTANGSTSKSKTVWITNECGRDETPPSSASIEVHKSVSGTAPQGTTFPFDVSCTAGDVTGGSFSLAAGASSTATVTWDGETAPSCTVTETNARGASSTAYVVDGGASTPGTAATTDTLEDGATSVVTFTNTFTTSGGGCEIDCGPPPVVVVDIPTTTVPAPTTTVPAPTTTEAPTTTIAPQVEGVQVVAPAPPAQVQPAQLARTGAMTDRLIIAAGLCLLLGGVVLTASKERTAVPTRRR